MSSRSPLSILGRSEGRTHSTPSRAEPPHTRAQMPPSQRRPTPTLSPPSPAIANTCWASLPLTISHLTPLASTLLFPTLICSLFPPRAPTSSVSSFLSPNPPLRQACNALSWVATLPTSTSPNPLAPFWKALSQGSPPRICWEMTTCLRRISPDQLQSKQISWKLQKQSMWPLL